ncbi:hypothetical protein HDEF_0259 [Candidatus Hamiltonella defensa 5AT (Acyrthosiphon pisum)]|uniref:Uncharacterized protein n=1 Tax=Hamiltonella defensa subsp. Acyrthosiphon pisum (strain 5AT) TaxID=572265 RepID=C4K382_HAMD5|nr:hypothetical protein HDEF_0259 [Candidatus Hamiltonella defensa 5AT (Acyrthosiphon pisum)]
MLLNAILQNNFGSLIDDFNSIDQQRLRQPSGSS